MGAIVWSFSMLFLHFQKSFRTRVAEWYFSFVQFFWGVVLLQPGDTFTNSKTYTVMASWFSEATWGWVLLLSGAVRLAALFANGAVRPSPHARAFCACISSFLFAQITLGVLLSGGPWSTGLAAYGPAVAFELYNAMRALKDAGEVDRRARHAGASS